MTGSNLIALAPWIIFGAALAAVYARLLGSRHASSRPAERPPTCSWSRPTAAAPRPRRSARGSPPAATSTGVGHHEQLRRDHGRRAGRSGLVRRGRSARPGVP